MPRTGPSPGTLSREWQYALVGGVISMPLTLAHYWQTGGGNEFSANMVLVGGLVAGFLARRYGADPGDASIRAGVVGGLAGYVWIAPTLIESAATFSLSGGVGPVVVLLFVVFSAIVLGIAALVGLLGGALGSWLGKQVGSARANPAGT